METNTPTPTRKIWFGGLSNILAIIAIIGTSLTLLGFGASLALETFGLDSSDVYDSPFDFLVLSSYVIGEIFNASYEQFTNTEQNRQWYFVIAPVLSLIILGILVLCFLIRKYILHPGPVRTYVNEHWPVAQRFSASIWARSWVKLIVIALAAWIVSASIWRVALMVLIGLTFLLVTPPLIGFTVATHHINKYVIQASKCAPLYSQRSRYLQASQRNQAATDKNSTVAVCLRVSKDGKELGRGRKIERNQNTVFLFKPDTGEVLSVPIKDAIVEQIERL